jgi:hypothetical protein
MIRWNASASERERMMTHDVLERICLGEMMMIHDDSLVRQVGAAGLKVPQILLILANKSAEGLAVTSVYAEVRRHYKKFHYVRLCD